MPKLAHSFVARQSAQWRQSTRIHQALEILQASCTRLQQIVSQKLEENPLLDMEVQPSGLQSKPINESREPQELNFDKDCFGSLEMIDEDYHYHFQQSEPDYAKEQEDWHEKAMNQLAYQPNFMENIKNQLYQVCLNSKLRETALQLAGFINEWGLIDTPLEQISEFTGLSLERIQLGQQLLQQLEPKGLGSSSLQEALLCQLEHRGHKQSLAYAIVKDHYDDLLHNRLHKIAKSLHSTCEDISSNIKSKLAPLQFQLRPTNQTNFPQPIDIFFNLESGELIATLSEESHPNLCINMHYVRQLQSLQKDKSYLKSKLSECRWLIESLRKRRENLLKVAYALAKSQQPFLCSQGPIKPLTLQDISKECGLHVSTVARAVQHKLAQAPCGVIALSDLFSFGYTQGNQSAKISSDAICEKIAGLIAGEDPQNPLTDEKIVELLKEDHIECARRTIAKYRARLSISSSSKRKRYT